MDKVTTKEDDAMPTEYPPVKIVLIGPDGEWTWLGCGDSAQAIVNKFKGVCNGPGGPTVDPEEWDDVKGWEFRDGQHNGRSFKPYHFGYLDGPRTSPPVT